MKILSILTLICIVASIGKTQTAPPLAQRGQQVGADYALDKLESINLVNGNLTYTISLSILPPNPVGTSTPVGLVYNSQIWDVSQSVDASTGVNRTRNQPSHVSGSGGWQYSYNYRVNIKPRAGCNDNNL